MAVLVVDGYNVAYAIPEIKEMMDNNLMGARKKVVQLCREYARSSGYIKDTKVVFDGKDEYRIFDKIDINRSDNEIYSSTGQGDEKIIETIKIWSKKNRVVVASNDNYLVDDLQSHASMKKRDLAKKEKEKPMDDEFLEVYKEVEATSGRTY